MKYVIGFGLVVCAVAILAAIISSAKEAPGIPENEDYKQTKVGFI